MVAPRRSRAGHGMGTPAIGILGKGKEGGMRKAPRYVRPGDVVEIGITGLGVQNNRVVTR